MKQMRFIMVFILMVFVAVASQGCKNAKDKAPADAKASDKDKEQGKKKDSKAFAKLEYRQDFLDCRDTYDKWLEWSMKNQEEANELAAEYSDLPNMLQATEEEINKHKDGMVKALAAGFEAAGLDTACAKAQVYHYGECIPYTAKMEDFANSNPEKMEELKKKYPDEPTEDLADTDFEKMEKDLRNMMGDMLELSGGNPGCSDILSYYTVAMMKAFAMMGDGLAESLGEGLEETVEEIGEGLGETMEEVFEEDGEEEDLDE